MKTNRILFALAAIALSGAASAAQIGADSKSASQAAADSAARAGTGDINIGGSRAVDSIDTTPTVYVPPVSFGQGATCGASDTLAIGVTGIGGGTAISKVIKSCDDREDSKHSAQLGDKEIARMRFYCFGQDVNRMAYEAVGGRCPAFATARGAFDPRNSTMASNATFEYPNSGGQ